MATITVTLTGICAGGEHLTFSVTGDAALTVRMSLSEVLAGLSNEDKEGFVKSLVKLGKIGRTNAQLRTLFQAGVTVSV